MQRAVCASGPFGTTKFNMIGDKHGNQLHHSMSTANAISRAVPTLRNALDRHMSQLQNRFVLGLDVSVTCTGLVLLSGDGRRVFSELALPRTNANVLSAGSQVAATLNQMLSLAGRHVVETGVEDFAMQFSANASSTQSRFTLARINGIASYEAWKQTGSGVVFHRPQSMRTSFGLASSTAKATKGQKDSPDGPADSTTAASASKQRAARKLAGKDGVLRLVGAVFPEVLEQQAAFEAEQLRAKYGASVKPDAAVTKALRSTQYDRADAVLTAMYTLLQHLEWRLLSAENGSVFEQVVDEVVPTARLGTRVVTPQERPVVQAAVVRLHAQEMKAQTKARAGPSGTVAMAGGLEAEDTAEDALLLAKPKAKTRRKAQKTDSALSLSSALSPEEAVAVERLYWRVRDSLGSATRDILVHDVFGWAVPRSQR